MKIVLFFVAGLLSLSLPAQEKGVSPAAGAGSLTDAGARPLAGTYPIT